MSYALLTLAVVFLFFVAWLLCQVWDGHGDQNFTNALISAVSLSGAALALSVVAAFVMDKLLI